MTGEHIFLGEMKANLRPGLYTDAIMAGEQAGTEYWGIWNILAFHPMASYHICELSRELMHREAPLSAALRELIAAYTSSLNRCDFCMHAHAAVPAHLHGDSELVLVSGGEAFVRLGARMVAGGYSREQPTHAQKEQASHA